MSRARKAGSPLPVMLCAHDLFAAGYVCPTGTGVLSALLHGCGSPEEHCPAGSSVRTPTPPGFHALATADGLYFNVSVCERGRFCIGGVFRLCPAGRYGSALGVAVVECTGNCSAGFYCPAGSVSQVQANCADGPGSFCPEVRPLSVCAPVCMPQTIASGELFARRMLPLVVTVLQGTATVVPAAPGFYTLPGTGLDATNQVTQVACQPGQYCSDGVTNPCPAGTFGATEALPSSACSGPCAAGYTCPASSTSPTQTPCGGVGVYCPEGSAMAMFAAPGEYTVGPTYATRTGILPCPSGSYCVGGMRSPCEAGTFGCADRLSIPTCNGPCTAGFFCPAGSVSSQQSACGGSASAPDAASYFCPQGAAAALRVGAGNYSTGSPADVPHRRTGQAVCPPGRYCAGGVTVCVCVRAFIRACVCLSF